METGSGCFLSFSALTQQIRPVEGERKNLDWLCQKEAIKRNIELPVTIHEARDDQRSRCLSSLLCLTRKHNVS